MERSSVIVVRDLTKKFGKTVAVDDVSFSVSPGQVVGFVGPNGAGKTTTISLMMGFIGASIGEIAIFGDKVKPSRAHRHHKQIGYIAGDMALYDNLTGKQYIKHMAALTRKNKQRQAELIELLSPQLDKRIKTLSRGNKQKIALVAALQHRPKLLIFDEPTTGLDPLMQETFADIIGKEARDGTTVFMSSHILSEVTTMCDRVMFMKHGTIVLDTNVKELESQSGKHVSITASKSTLLSLLKQRPRGITQTDHTGSTISFIYQGSIQTLLAWVGSKKVTDFTVRDRDFDSIFAELYKEDTPS